jgi:hypothetical protein
MSVRGDRYARRLPSAAVLAPTGPDAWTRRVNPDELDDYETDLELALYREYRDVVALYRYVVETERRFYLCNEVELTPHPGDEEWFELRLTDAWVWDMYRPARFLRDVRVLTFRDVNVEELAHQEQELPAFMEP